VKLVQESRIYGLKNIPNNRYEERFLGFLCTAGSVMRRPNIVTYKKEKVAQILSTEDGAEKTASGEEEEKNHEEHPGSGAQSQVEMGSICSRNGVAQTGTPNINVRRTIVPGDRRPDGQTRSRRILRQSAHEGGKVVSPTHRLPLTPGNIPGTHFW
jgi:hypothetical protein